MANLTSSVLDAEFLVAKQKFKDNKIQLSDEEIFDQILNESQIPIEFLTKVSINDMNQRSDNDPSITDDAEYIKIKIVSKWEY